MFASGKAVISAGFTPKNGFIESAFAVGKVNKCIPIDGRKNISIGGIRLFQNAPRLPYGFNFFKRNGQISIRRYIGIWLYLH